MEWYVHSTHGNMFQSGFPDVYCGHLKYGQRWIEVKNPAGFSFTQAQMREFPKMRAAGIGIWILMFDSDKELMKLFQPANWERIYYDYVMGIRKIYI